MIDWGLYRLCSVEEWSSHFHIDIMLKDGSLIADLPLLVCSDNMGMPSAKQTQEKRTQNKPAHLN